MTVERSIGEGASVAAILLGWYDDHARVLPWRTAPGSGGRADPYRVWLSEIMLQQTTVTAVAPHFARFVDRWPDVAALAAAADSDVMAAWAGLGYYARARNLIACARTICEVHGGVFPDTEAGLRALPGIGDYTAAAVAAIAFDRRAVVVDANVERVAARLFAIVEPLPKAKRAIRAAVDAMTPSARAGDFAQAMMDLGASVCTVRAPQCDRCPLSGHCEAYQRDIAESLPVKPAKRARPLRHGWAHWVVRDGQVMLVRRAGRGMLGGMRALPGGEWTDALAELPQGGRDSGIAVQHVFTHFALQLHVATLAPESPCLAGAEAEWWPLADIGDAGLPTLYAKAVRAMMAGTQMEGT